MKYVRFPFVLAVFVVASSTVLADEPVVMTVESSLKTDREHIRQFVFDGQDKTFFRSQQAPTDADHFTIRLDREIHLRSLEFKTGEPDKTNESLKAEIELSSNGQTFEAAGSLRNDDIKWASSKSDGNLGKVTAIRIKFKAEQMTPVVIREIVIHSSPELHHYPYPIEIDVDTSDSPELKELAEQVAAICTKWYPLICEELKTEGYTPTTHIDMKFTKAYKGVAATSNDKVIVNSNWFKNNPSDIGALIHETTHVVQHYRGKNNPGWLVEGMTDYYRFFIFEPGNIGQIAKDPHFDGSYRTTAAFLKYCVDTYGGDLLKKLNQSLRDGTYDEALFQSATGKSLRELDEDWRAALGLKKN